MPLRALFFSFVTFVLTLGLFGCAKSQAKHYPLRGKIMAVDKLGHQLIVDHDAIPGFMEAMTMPYNVADNAMLEKVGPGDEIKAEISVEPGRIQIDQIEVVKKAVPGTTPVPTPMHVPQTGKQVPNPTLTNPG